MDMIAKSSAATRISVVASGSSKAPAIGTHVPTDDASVHHHQLGEILRQFRKNMEKRARKRYRDGLLAHLMRKKTLNI